MAFRAKYEHAGNISFEGFTGQNTAEDRIEWLNDKTIAFLAHNGCLSEIGAFKTSGGEPNLERFSDSVVYTTISLSSDHQFAAATGHSPEHPFEVFVSTEPGPGGTPVRVTDVNPWLKEKRLAKYGMPSSDGVEAEDAAAGGEHDEVGDETGTDAKEDGK